MLKCKDIPSLSDDYLEGNLSFKRKMPVMAHLAICKHCRGYLNNLQMTIDIIRTSEGIINDKHEIDDIINRIETTQPPFKDQS